MCVFQSYLSPIQTDRRVLHVPCQRLDFQSYLSPIQTTGFWPGLPCGAGSFQSYLSPIQTSLSIRSWALMKSFNPTLVQFKRCTWTDDFTCNASFNPTLVQFKPSGSRRLCFRTRTFNPTLVQFKQEMVAAALAAEESFNPTLVQFKRAPGPPLSRGESRFQSYLSPIQTWSGRMFPGSSRPLSILP